MAFFQFLTNKLKWPIFDLKHCFKDLFPLIFCVESYKSMLPNVRLVRKKLLQLCVNSIFSLFITKCKNELFHLTFQFEEIFFYFPNTRWNLFFKTYLLSWFLSQFSFLKHNVFFLIKTQMLFERKFDTN